MIRTIVLKSIAHCLDQDLPIRSHVVNLETIKGLISGSSICVGHGGLCESAVPCCPGLECRLSMSGPLSSKRCLLAFDPFPPNP